MKKEIKENLEEQFNILIDKWSSLLNEQKINLKEGTSLLKESVKTVFDEVWDEIVDKIGEDDEEEYDEVEYDDEKEDIKDIVDELHFITIEDLTKYLEKKHGRKEFRSKDEIIELIFGLLETISQLLNELKKMNNEVILTEQGTNEVKVYVQKGDKLETHSFNDIEELDKFIKDNNLRNDQYSIIKGE